MHENQFVFDGLERIDQVILHLDPEVAYFILRDRNLPGKDGYIGRLDFEPKDVAPYVYYELEAAHRPRDSRSQSCRPSRPRRMSSQELEELDPEFLMLEDDETSDSNYPPDDDAPTDDEVPDDEDNGADDLLDESLENSADESPDGSGEKWLVDSADRSLGAGGGQRLEDLDHRSMLRGVCRWIRDFAIAHVQSTEAAHILLRVYGPKGAKVIISCSFFVRNRFFNRTMADQALRAAREVGERKRAAEAAQAPHREGADSTSGYRTPSRGPSGLFAGHTPGTNAAAPAGPTGPGGFAGPAGFAGPGGYAGHSGFAGPGGFAGHSGLASPAGQPSFPPPPGMLLYPANYQDGTLFGTQGAFRALNESYESFGRTMVGGMNQIQSMMGQVIQDMGQELHSARAQVSDLVDSVLDNRARQVEAQAQIDQTNVMSEERKTLARDAIQQIGEAAKALFLSKGLSKESAELAGTLSSHPALMTALQEPDVRELLSDPSNLDVLAGALRRLGQQNQLMKASAEQGGPDAVLPGQAPAALPPGGGFQTPGAQVSVSPGLAARAAARAHYNNSVPGGHPGAVQPPMVYAHQWPGSNPQQGTMPPAYPGGGRVVSTPPFGTQGPAPVHGPVQVFEPVPSGYPSAGHVPSYPGQHPPQGTAPFPAVTSGQVPSYPGQHPPPQGAAPFPGLASGNVQPYPGQHPPQGVAPFPAPASGNVQPYPGQHPLPQGVAPFPAPASGNVQPYAGRSVQQEPAPHNWSGGLVGVAPGFYPAPPPDLRARHSRDLPPGPPPDYYANSPAGRYETPSQSAGPTGSHANQISAAGVSLHQTTTEGRPSRPSRTREVPPHPAGTTRPRSRLPSSANLETTADARGISGRRPALPISNSPPGSSAPPGSSPRPDSIQRSGSSAPPGSTSD